MEMVQALACVTQRLFLLLTILADQTQVEKWLQEAWEMVFTISVIVKQLNGHKTERSPNTCILDSAC